MSLTLTAPTISGGDEPSAAIHRDLLLAVDELLTARFNERTWLVFDTTPALELGDVCIFGTPSNLNSGAYTAYDTADETPANPTSGDVVSYDTSTKVIWLTGYSDTTTLNRRMVDYDPGTGTETWWVGTVRPQRWEPLRIADILIEDYTDPIAADNVTFTWRSHWDKHGCVRFHNGNRFSITLTFEDASQVDVVIPAYGILSGRRSNYDQPFTWDAKYLHLTQEDDPLRWNKWEAGQFAASMELLDLLFTDSANEWLRYVPVIDNDSTDSEKASFTGSALSGTDKLWDWLWHRGYLLSVVLDRRDGTTTVTPLQWDGVGSVPDASWSGHVDVTIGPFDAITFESAATAPSGASPTEWEHDLIPISTNITGGAILQLQPGPVTLNPAAISWEHYTAPLPVATLGASNSTYYSTESGGATTATVVSRTANDVTPGTGYPEDDVSDLLPTPGSGTTALQKVFGAIGRTNAISTSATFGASEFSEELLRRVDTSGTLMEWLTASHYGLTGRLRFVARKPRRYHTADPDHDYHPQDKDVLGTTDGLGGALGVTLAPVSSSPISIEGSPWTEVATPQGSTMLVPSDQLHAVGARINESGWWNTNRDRIIAGTFDDADDGIAWRPPRLTEQWNAIANAVNAVQEVYRADIRHLFKDPLPSDVNHPPFSYSGEEPFAVPADWICGRHDGDATLFDWATLWGVTATIGIPDVDTLAALDRKVWATQVNAGGDVCALSVILFSATTGTNSTTTVNGYDYRGYNALDADRSRLLFGGAGDWSDYVYLTYADADAVFGPLGVPVPPPPAGERYDPVIEEDTGATALNGSLASGPAVPGYYTAAQAQQAFRSPSTTGTWLAVFDGELAGRSNVPFRLCSAVGSEKRIISWINPDDTSWTSFRRDCSTACVESGPLSPRYKTLYTSAATAPIAELYISEGENAWLSGTEVYSTTPFLIIAAPEMWCEFERGTIDYGDTGTDPDETGTDPDETYSVTNHTPSSGGLSHKEYEAGAVDVDALIADGWSSHGAYHCQVVQRAGVLRA